MDAALRAYRRRGNVTPLRVGTVVAVAAYLTLLGRIGPARAGYATVMFPVFALLISTALEGYQWTVYAVAGLGLVTMGNILVIRGGRR